MTSSKIQEIKPEIKKSNGWGGKRRNAGRKPYIRSTKLYFRKSPEFRQILRRLGVNEDDGAVVFILLNLINADDNLLTLDLLKAKRAAQLLWYNAEIRLYKTPRGIAIALAEALADTLK